MTCLHLVLVVATLAAAAPPPSEPSAVPAGGGAGSARSSRSGPESTAEALAEGKQEFERGVALLRDARYAEAAARLERSVALFESPSALYNLALAYRGMGAYRRAITTLERFLQLASGAHAELREGAARLLGELHGSLVALVVEVSGGPDTLALDGDAVPFEPGRDPLRLELLVDPGSHVLVATKRGHRPVEVEVRDLIRGADPAGATKPGAPRTVALDVAGAPLPAELQITARPDSAIVAVDGAVRGSGRVQASVAPGEHTIEVSAPEHEPERRIIVLEPGASQQLEITLSVAEPSILGRWWFWAGVAAAGAVVAGAVVAGTGGGPDYDGGTFGFTLQN